MLDVPFLGEVPIDPQVVIGGDTGEPIFVLAPKSIATQALRELARQIVNQIESGLTGHTHSHDEPMHDHAHTH